jgi:hypothetical protein
VNEHLAVYRSIQPLPLSLRLPVADALLVLIAHAVEERGLRAPILHAHSCPRQGRCHCRKQVE